MFSLTTVATDSDASVELDCLYDNVIKPYNVGAPYDDSDQTVVSKTGRFDVDAASSTAAMAITILTC